MIGEDNFREISDQASIPRNPLVSVHMLAYRHGDFLAQAIESVVSQECDFSFDLIIAEDCSPDESLTIALAYQKRYPSIIRVLTGNQNVGIARNVARLSKSNRGRFIAICEGDDFWCDPTKLRRQVAIFRRFPDCSLVFHSAKVVDASTGQKLSTIRHSLFSRIFSTDEIILGDGGLVPTASILVKQESTTKSPKWQTNAPVGDYALVLRAAAVGKIIYLDRVMSCYRTNVPHSWTMRHVPDLTARVFHARRIEAMLNGFAVEQKHQFDASIKTMISKYYSDPLVRLAGLSGEKKLIYCEFSKKLLITDRMLSWLAIHTGVRLSLVKDLLRKLFTLTRLARAHITSDRISIE